MAKSGDEAVPAVPPGFLTQKLFDARTILICGEIDSDLAQSIVAQALGLAAMSDDDITVYIHSPGGHVESSDTIHDIFTFIRPRVRMIGTGWVASGGVHIFLAAEREDRYSLPNTRFLIHQPLGGAGGRATDIEIEATEILKARARLNRIIAERTGQQLKKVEKDTERNFWMTAAEAKEYGIVGKIITSANELKR